MTRNENDLRDALHELQQRADQHGAPSTARILTHSTEDRLGRHRDSATPRFTRWLAPLAAAAVVAAAAVTAVALSASPHRAAPAGGQPTDVHATARHTASAAHPRSAKPTPTTSAGGILEDAAAALDAAPAWTTPAPQDFFYIRTSQATTWTSVSGTRAGEGQTAHGDKISVPGCRGGQIVADGESGTCTLNGTPHYLGDAPTVPSAWDGYLEQIAPGAKAADAQGKIIVAVLHEYLTAPNAAAALLRYTASCPGLHTVTVRPVAGETLVGVTCTSMTNGSYGLAFDATSHALAGFVVVNSAGEQDGAAEIVTKTGIVATIGSKP